MTNGVIRSRIQSGWVTICRRLIMVAPRKTIGMMTIDETM